MSRVNPAPNTTSRAGRWSTSISRGGLPSTVQSGPLNHVKIAPPNNPPTIGSVTASPSGETGIESLTAFTFTAQNVADLDGDTVTVQWQFGDGTTATGLTATHTYARSATFEVTATATDGKGGASSPKTQSVTVANLNGSWSNVYDNQTRVFTLTQNGTALSGTYTNTGLPGVTATVTGQVSTPRSIALTASGGGITPVSITGAVGPTCTWFEGLVAGGGAAGQTLRFVKQ